MKTLIKIDLDEDSGQLDVSYVSLKEKGYTLLTNALVSIINCKADFRSIMLTVIIHYLSTLPEGDAADLLAFISEREQEIRKKIINDKEL